MKKALLVFNPVAGKGKVKPYIADVIQALIRKRYLVEAFATQKEGDASRYARERGSGADLIVCLGGDGTLNEIINGVITLSEIPEIGYIPMGSTNDFAESIGLPADFEDCLSIAVKGKSMLYDIGDLNGRKFLYVAALGAFSAVSYSTPQQAKNILGRTAYLMQGMKELGNLKPQHLELRMNGKRLEGDFLIGMISNSESVGGFKGLTMETDYQDGLFECTFVVNPTNPIEFATTMAGLLSGNASEDQVKSFRAEELTIISDEEIRWSLDGEFGGSYKESKIRVLRKAVAIRTFPAGLVSEL